MKKIDFKIFAATCLACLVPIVFGMYYYNKLPDRVPVHFNYNNVPDNYAPKFFGVIGMPLLLLLLQAVLCIVNDLADKNKRANRKIIIASKWMIPVVSLVVNLMVILYSLGRASNISRPVCILLGVILIVLGNYLPKTKQNSTIGVRTKYTLGSEEIWNKASRITGYTMIVFGILFMVSAFLGSLAAAVVLIAFIAAMLIVSFIYPYRLSKKHKTGPDQ